MISEKRRIVFLSLLCVLFLGGLVVLPLAGMEWLSMSAYARKAGLESDILWKIRMPRVAGAFMAGCILSLCGMIFQAVFRNPLASPYTLGVSSGASFGAALGLRLGFSFSFLGFGGTGIFAFCGALLTILMVYGFSRLRRTLSSASMLLAGISVGFFFSSLILLLQYLSSLVHSFRITRWIMGSLDFMDWSLTVRMAPFFFLALLTAYAARFGLNVLATGEELAIGRGMNTERTKALLFVIVSLCVGGVVSTCGPIGFVGIMVPHICRGLVGSDHRYLVPATFLGGGIFLAFCDALARSVMAPAEVPVGVITSILGGPFFLWILLRRKSFHEFG